MVGCARICRQTARRARDDRPPGQIWGKDYVSAALNALAPVMRSSRFPKHLLQPIFVQAKFL
jgi:hypothetical protein